MFQVIRVTKLWKFVFKFRTPKEAFYHSSKVSSIPIETLQILGEANFISLSKEEHFVESGDESLVKGPPGKFTMRNARPCFAIPSENGEHEPFDHAQSLYISRSVDAQYLTNKF